MENKYVYRIDGSYEESLGVWHGCGQIFVLFGCFVLLLFSIVFTVIDYSTYIWFLVFWVLLIVFLLFIFSKLYYIEYDANWFYLKRLFYKTQKISVDDFLAVKKAPILSTPYVSVVFKDKKVLTMGKTLLNPFKNLSFMKSKEYHEIHTAEIKNNIKKAKNELNNAQNPKSEIL